MISFGCERLTFGYANLPSILDDVSLTAQAGELVAITGPSGRGKSTLLYLLGLMLSPRAGAVLVDGDAVSGLRDAQRSALRAQLLGFVFQDAALDQTRTVMDNITEVCLYGDLDRRLAQERAQLLIDQLGVQVPAHRRPGQISGGQAQRIALCRALVHDPAVLLADEPTGNLDDSSAEGVIHAMRRHAETGRAVIVVTHDPRLEQACDRSVPL
ncbi:MAG: ATP-binding cassette domain-containing protein [Micropruina sp.]|nr:ATP-binding cassette domain-containing protein [Micropruina sp.]